MSDITTKIPAGDLQLYDYYKPPLVAGDYTIDVTQALGIGEGEAFEVFAARQEFVVSAPQFVLDPTQIVNQYPPAGSTGLYGEVLPHIVLRDPMLAWERSVFRPEAAADNAQEPVPWLALLVFEEGDLLPGDDPTTQTTTADIRAFMALNGSQGGKVLAPTLRIGRDVQEALDAEAAPPRDDSHRVAPCQYIRMPATVFCKVVPRLDELRYLSHVRKVDTGDRPTLGLSEHGLYAVTMANRFPAVPPKDTAARKNIVHLVSLEGMAEHLKGPTVPAGCSELALLSLASWTFLAQHDLPMDFKALANKLVPPGSLAEARWLRLPAPPEPPTPPREELKAARAEVQRRLDLGYAPLAYHTRSGEDTVAWYRGPLAPQPSAAGPGLGPFPSADAALIYDRGLDVFDVSLAAAWELGREVALADVSFGPKMLHFRRNAAQLLDTLHHQLGSVHLAGGNAPAVAPAQRAEALSQQIAALEIITVQEAFTRLLTDQANPLTVESVGAVGIQDHTGAGQAGPAAGSAPAPGAIHGELTEMLTSLNSLREARATMYALLAEDLAPLADWLGRFLLLFLVPFDNLVPDKGLLPAESLRFFYLDEQWFRAALDGALSLGQDSSKHGLIDGLVRETLFEEAKRAASQASRKADNTANKAAGSAKKTPTDPPPAPALPNGISGFLLRSDLVVGWPNLAVYPKDERGQAIPILRIDHLAPDILLCLFDGVPKQLVLSEPAESLRFGIEEDGTTALRSISGNEPGHQLTDKTVPVWDKSGGELRCMRTKDAAGRVLNLAPGSPAQGISADENGLINALAKKLNLLPEGLSPSAFSLQLVKAPEALMLPPPPETA